jgi:hypothetical protein
MFFPVFSIKKWIILTHLLRWWIAVAEIIIHSVNLGTMVYAKSVGNLYIVAKEGVRNHGKHRSRRGCRVSVLLSGLCNHFSGKTLVPISELSTLLA